MKTLYLEGAPTTIRKNKNGLVFVSPSLPRDIVALPPYLPYDHVILQRARGYVSLDALRSLMAQRISVSVLDFRGNLIGQMHPGERKTGDLWLRQFRAASDPKKRLSIAKRIAIESYARKGVPPGAFGTPRSVPELMQAEARISDRYWTAWRARLSDIWPAHDFTARGRPDYDAHLRAVSAVNAALNYGLSLLEAMARTICHRVGLHPQIGFLHRTDPHKEGLVYDIQEYGRAWVDDAILDWFREPANRKGYYRSPDWTIRFRPKMARSLVEAVSPAIRGPTLFRDTRGIARRL
jgi:CRISPR/Cas system-associated endonuclease Cas1